MKKYFLALTVLLITFYSHVIFSQTIIKKGIKGGVELYNSLTEETGTFDRSFGFMFGIYTGINLKSYQTSSLLLKSEINIVNLQYHNPNSIKYLNHSFPSEPQYTTYDELFGFFTVELGFIPAYQYRINQDFLIEFYTGPSVGIGSKSLSTKHLDSLQLDHDPWDEYTMGPLFSANLNVGTNLFYKNLLIDFKYRYTTLEGARKSEHSNFYILLGVGF